MADPTTAGTAPAGDGTNPPAERTFTQADLDRMIGSRIATEKKTSDALRAEVEAAKAKLAEFDQVQQRLQALEDEKLSTADKARKDADRAAAALAAKEAALVKERDEWKGKAETAEKRRVESALLREISDALGTAKALPSALKHASPTFRAEVEIDTDESGAITAVRYAGTTQKDLVTAAGAWLAANPHFLQHPGGGSGSAKPNGTGAGGPALQQMTPAQAMAVALAARDQRR